MANKKGTGVLIVTIYNVPPEKEAEWGEWYKAEHLPENLAVPGFLNAARYLPVGSGPQHMTCYELETPDAINHPVLIERHKQPPSEWSARASSVALGGKVVINNVYKQIFPSEVSPETAQSDMAQFLAIELMDVPAEVEDEFNDWYNTTYLPRLQMEPGCIRGRRYTATKGEPKYATVYELEDEKAYERARSAAARDANPRTKTMLPQLLYAKDFPSVFRKYYQP